MRCLRTSTLAFSGRAPPAYLDTISTTSLRVFRTSLFSSAILAFSSERSASLRTISWPDCSEPSIDPELFTLLPLSYCSRALFRARMTFPICSFAQRSQPRQYFRLRRDSSLIATLRPLVDKTSRDCHELPGDLGSSCDCVGIKALAS